MHRYQKPQLAILFVAALHMLVACSESSPMSEPGTAASASTASDIQMEAASKPAPNAEVVPQTTPETGSQSEVDEDQSLIDLQVIVDEAAVRSKAMYNGLRTPANLTLAIANEFVHNAHAGVFPQKTKLSDQTFNENDWNGLSWLRIHYLPFFGAPRESMYTPLTNATLNCGPDSASGSMKVSSQPTDAKGAVLVNPDIIAIQSNNPVVHQRFTVDYSNCISGNTPGEYNGRVHVFIQSGSNSITSRDTRRLVYVFENLSVSINNEAFQINGNSQWPDYASCTDDGVLTNNLHIQHLGSGKSVLMTDLKFYWPNPYESSCNKFTLTNPSYLSGSLSLSDHGSVEFYIPEDIDPLLGIWTNDLENLYFLSDEVNAEALIASHVEPQLSHDDQNLDNTITSLNITNQITHSSESISHTSWDFKRGSMLDLNDDDGDGMSNSWEIIHGLNPNDASDATSDLDNDGLSNLVEFNSLGHPNEKSIRGIELDDKIVQPPAYLYVANLELRIFRSVAAQSKIDTFHTIVIDAEAEGEWIFDGFLDNAKDICTVQTESNQLQCDEEKFNAFGDNDLLSFAFRPTTNAKGFYTFTASMHTYDYDHNGDNNTVSWDAWHPGGEWRTFGETTAPVED